jgi:6-phosphogluconolactonase (cycloisomerase 2 family)
LTLVQSLSIAETLGAIAIDPSGQFVYVGAAYGNAGLGSIHAFAVNTATGVFTEVGSEISDSSTPNVLTVDPTGNFLYAGNAHGGATGQGSVTVYAIDRATGALSTDGISHTDNDNPYGIVVDPSGSFVYTANASGIVRGFSLEPATGAPVEIAGSPYPAGNVPQSIVMTADGRFVYVENSSLSAGLSVYSRDGTTGILQPLSPPPFSILGGEIAAMDPLGRFLYLTSWPGNAPSFVSGFTIDASSGSLTPLSRAPDVTNLYPWMSVMDPSGQLLLVLNRTGGVGFNEGSISVYTVDPATGVLTLGNGSPFGVPGATPQSMVVH